MIWTVKASYKGDTVEFTLVTDKDDLKEALVEARAEAERIFSNAGGGDDRPTVHVVKHKDVL